MDAFQIKSILRLDHDDKKYDEYINAILPSTKQFVKQYCNLEKLPDYMTALIAKMVQFNMNTSGLASRNVGDLSFSYTTNYPDSILQELQSYRKAKFI